MHSIDNNYFGSVAVGPLFDDKDQASVWNGRNIAIGVASIAVAGIALYAIMNTSNFSLLEKSDFLDAAVEPQGSFLDVVVGSQVPTKRIVDWDSMDVNRIIQDTPAPVQLVQPNTDEDFLKTAGNVAIMAGMFLGPVLFGLTHPVSF